MKKIPFVFLAALFLSGAGLIAPCLIGSAGVPWLGRLAAPRSCAAADDLWVLRNKILAESKAIRGLVKENRDIIIVNTMWDSGVMTVSQIDGYFAMAGIINTIERDALKPEAISQVVGWLKDTKKNVEGNVKGLNSIAETIEAGTRLHMEVLKGQFAELAGLLAGEIEKQEKLLKAMQQKAQ